MHPSHWGEEPTERHGAFDPDRDAVTLPLIRECVARGVPIFGICRGFQEFNVAFGGTLHPEIREIPGRMNHRMPPDGTLEEKFEHRHPVRLTPGGAFERVLGAQEVVVNSLHGQGILARGARVVIEGFAPDDTPEAIQIDEAPGFAMAVQWHPGVAGRDRPRLAPAVPGARRGGPAARQLTGARRRGRDSGSRNSSIECRWQ